MITSICQTKNKGRIMWDINFPIEISINSINANFDKFIANRLEEFPGMRIVELFGIMTMENGEEKEGMIRLIEVLSSASDEMITSPQQLIRNPIRRDATGIISDVTLWNFATFVPNDDSSPNGFEPIIS
jgi:hypothetical protein